LLRLVCSAQAPYHSEFEPKMEVKLKERLELRLTMEMGSTPTLPGSIDDGFRPMLPAVRSDEPGCAQETPGRFRHG
jgi:hypothetical protein